MTTETLWIIVAVLVAVFAVAVILGLVLRRRRRISLREPAEVDRPRPDAGPPRRGGTYQASGGFNFASGTEAPPRPEPPRVPVEPAPPRVEPVPPRAEPAPATPPRAEPATPPRPEPAPAPAPPPVAEPPARATGSHRADAAPPVVEPEALPAPPTAAAPAPEAATPAPDTTPDTAPDTTRDTAAPDAVTPATGVPVAAPDAPTPPTGVPVVGVDTATPVTGTPVVEPAAPPTAAAGPTTVAEPAPDTVPDTAPASRNGATRTAPVPTIPAEPVPEPAAQRPSEPIAPTEGRLERLRGRLARSRSGFGQGLLGLLGAGELDEESWEDVEAMLLQADLGPDTTAELVETLRLELARRAVRTPEQARQLLRDVLTGALRTDLDRAVRALPHGDRPGVVLVVGVNGTGKTTTTGKLARVLVANGRHVVLGAADTFRAAAAEQLGTWGERAGATVVRGPEGADPASVAFDAVKQATAEGADTVLLDTAGRLHTKTGLMDELGKVKRVVSRQAEVDEVLLVLDATTGQNGLIQARVFGDVVDVTGIVLTKLDGTAKGGIVFRVQRELGVPVKLVGLGEGPDDLAPFEPTAFVDALLN